MIPVLTSEESARLDRESEIPVSDLMERAGLAVALAAIDMGVGYGDRVLVLAGPGNNGGDGYVAARYLRQRGVSVSVGALAPPKTQVAADAARRAEVAGVQVGPVPSPHEIDLVIDAVFGGGGRSGLPDEIKAWIYARPRVLAVDIPTGLDPDTGEVGDKAFNAERTVSFHTPLVGQLIGAGPDHAGEIQVVDIGLEGGRPTLRIAEAHDAPRPARQRRAHKWSAGSVLVVGGAKGMVGAAVMAGRAALNFGAGAVGVASTDPHLVQALAPELLAYSIDSLPDRYNVSLIGPGLGDVRRLRVRPLEEALGGDTPLVLDADGLNAIGLEMLERIGVGGHRVLTPHAGEFQRLTGIARDAIKLRDIARVAEQANSTVLLKGNPSYVSDGTTPWLINSNGPELASIGTGDVLAGMVAALMARGLGPATAARSAAYWHGVAAADLASRTTVTADVLAREVGRFAWDPA